ncbi:protein YibB, partial [Campylobacter coli]|nr:protein YibB [Campylobacter coli]EDO6870010.1 protein YibB [Campylobacter coli]
FFVVDAIEKKLTNENIIWLDFGFNHGNEFFTNKAEFNFLLEKQEIINEEKINFFSVKEEEYRNIAHVYFNMEPFIMGGLIFAKSKNWHIFKEHMKNALNAFLSFGIVDDEQTMYLWCIRNYLNNYKIIRSYEWFDALFNFIPIEIKSHLSFKRKNSKYYKIIKEKIKNSKNKNLIYKIQLYIKYIYYKFINKKIIKL